MNATYLTNLEQVAFGPDNLEMTMVNENGDKMRVAFSPEQLQDFIGTMIEFAYRLGNNMHPEGPVTERTGIPTTMFQNTPATSISVAQLDANDPNDLLVCFRVWATDIGLRMNANDLKKFLRQLEPPAVH